MMLAALHFEATERPWAIGSVNSDLVLQSSCLELVMMTEWGWYLRNSTYSWERIPRCEIEVRRWWESLLVRKMDFRIVSVLYAEYYSL